MEFTPPTPLSLEEDGTLLVPTEGIEEGFARKFLYLDAKGKSQEVLVARRGGVLFAADSFCPHQGGRLAEGPLMGGEHFHCPLHLYRFEPDTGEPVEVLCRPLWTFGVVELEGEARVEVKARRP
ncbi:MAG TPA: hypothetical protein ENJ09_01790 [Planctomycetes bacterium]|nr:hypothetical protein [Planctomycetota bacterium]